MHFAQKSSHIHLQIFCILGKSPLLKIVNFSASLTGLRLYFPPIEGVFIEQKRIGLSAGKPIKHRLARSKYKRGCSLKEIFTIVWHLELKFPLKESSEHA